MTFGTGGYGPGDTTPTLGPGVPTTLNGRRAHRTSGNGEGCLGVGATDSISYAVLDGKTQGEFGVDFCFRGPGLSSLEHKADQVAQTLRIAPDPTDLGVHP